MVTNRRARFSALAKAAVLALPMLSLGSMGCLAGLNQMTPEELGHYFTLRTQGGASQLRVEGDRVYSSSVEVERMKDGGLRGRVGGEVLDLRTEEGTHVTGMIGSGMTDLHITTQGTATHAQGLFAGGLSNVTLSDASMLGTVGRCGYELYRSNAPGVWYEGRRSCGKSFEVTSFSPPKALQSLPPDERAVYLMLALAQ